MGSVKYNVLTIFTFTTDNKIQDIINKYSEKILLSINNNLSYNYCIVVTALNHLEFKELLNIDSEGLVIVSEHKSINPIAMGNYKSVLADNVYENITENYKNIDELQLTENLKPSDGSNNSYTYSEYVDFSPLFGEYDMVTETESVKNLSDEDILVEIDDLLDKGNIENEDKSRYDLLVNELKDRKNE